MARHRFLAHLADWPLAALVPLGLAAPRSAALKIMLKSAWGSDAPAKSAFPFSHALRDWRFAQMARSCIAGADAGRWWADHSFGRTR
jgi:hypothetical protein